MERFDSARPGLSITLAGMALEFVAVFYSKQIKILVENCMNIVYKYSNYIVTFD